MARGPELPAEVWDIEDDDEYAKQVLTHLQRHVQRYGDEVRTHPCALRVCARTFGTMKHAPCMLHPVGMPAEPIAALIMDGQQWHSTQTVASAQTLPAFCCT